MIVVAAALTYAWTFLDIGWERKVTGAFIVPALIVAFAILGPTYNEMTRKMLEWRPLTQLGLYSYGIYLWQQYFTREQAGAGPTDAAIAVLFSILAGAALWHVFRESISKSFQGLLFARENREGTMIRQKYPLAARGTSMRPINFNEPGLCTPITPSSPPVQDLIDQVALQI
jgi:peptidoglycan/LPS O-acetylase OafA/YrhL